MHAILRAMARAMRVMAHEKPAILRAIPAMREMLSAMRAIVNAMPQCAMQCTPISGVLTPSVSEGWIYS